MPSRDWRIRLPDILESITEIEQRTKGMTFEEFVYIQSQEKYLAFSDGLLLTFS
jgi:uncharacterized protein with HEPN domain